MNWFALSLSAASALVLTALLIPPLRRLAWSLQWVAMPAKDRWHETPVALLGGVAVVGSFACIGYVWGVSIWLILAALILCALGLIDDIVALSPRTKLICELPFALLAMAWIHIPPMLPWPWLQACGVGLWILTAINAFNLIDGLDGLAAGLGIFATLAIATIGVLHRDVPLVLSALTLCGALGAFLIYNFSPATIYLGDAGSLAIGFILGVLSLRSVHLVMGSRMALVAIPALLMAVPIIDTAIVTVTRLAAGRAISNRGLDHCHHRLARLGLSQRRVACVLWALGVTGGGWAIFLSSAPRAAIITLLPLCALMFATIGLFLANLSFEHEPPGRLYGAVPRLGRLILSLTYQRRAVEFGLDFLVISSAYYGALLIHHNFQLTWADVSNLSRSLPLLCAAAYGAFVVCKIYRQVWRYVGVEEALRFQIASALAGFFAAIALNVARIAPPASILVMFTILLFNLLLGTRVSFRIMSAVLNHLAAPIRKVLLVGAGSDGESAARQLLRDSDCGLSVVGFLDDDVFTHHKFVRGVRVLGGVGDLHRVYHETGFNEIVITQDDIPAEHLQLLQSFATDNHVAIHRFLARMDALSQQHLVGGAALDALPSPAA